MYTRVEVELKYTCVVLKIRRKSKFKCDKGTKKDFRICRKVYAYF